jgi:hypothetical protein
MPNHVPFRLNRSGFLLALISAAFSGHAGAAAGRVDFTLGATTVSGSDGRQRPLAKGAELDTGDTVRTAEDGRAQIRFTDGAYVSLQPNTEFAIKDYKFEGKTDGSERGLFALAKGAMRTVTGLIGRVNKNRYAISTPTATIGIRGTGGRIEILNDGSTLINGTSGIWTLTNPAGTIDVPAGVSARAPSAPNQPPQQTSEQPKAGPAQPAPVPVFVAGNQRTSTGDPASLCGTTITITGICPATVGNLNPPLVSGAGYHVSYAYSDLSIAGAPVSNVNSSGTLATAVFNAAGMLTQFTASNSATFTGTHQEFGTAAGVLAWGRWTGPIAGLDPATISLNPGRNQGYHYVVGLPATGMPTIGTAAFTFLGATKPTGTDGSFAPGTFSGTMSVNFGPSTGSVSLTASLAFSGFAYNFTAGSASFTPGSSAFTGSMTGTASGIVPAAYTCSGTCTATVNGAFFGAGAAYAGYAYRMPTGPTQSVTGAAVFKQ